MQSDRPRLAGNSSTALIGRLSAPAMAASPGAGAGLEEAPAPSFSAAVGLQAMSAGSLQTVVSRPHAISHS